MKLNEVVQRLNLEVKTCKEDLDREVTGGYSSDLLSWVMAHANEGNIWVTVQSHQNIIAVAVLLNLSAIIIAEGVEVEDSVLQKAEEEGVPVLTSSAPVYRICGEMYQMGIKEGEA